MFRLFLLVFVTVTATLFQVNAGGEECMGFGDPRLYDKCCKNKANVKMEIMDIKECAKEKKPPPNCDFDICLAKRNNLDGTEPGTFDKKKAETMVKSAFEDEPELAEVIVNHCVNGDLTKFAPPDFCDLIKYRHCLFNHLVAHCSEWDDSEECTEMKEMIAKCVH